MGRLKASDGELEKALVGQCQNRSRAHFGGSITNDVPSLRALIAHVREEVFPPADLQRYQY